jgi:flavin reductase (DIM6/NTAB) family NADH-FMN oxidoreductase RutF
MVVDPGTTDPRNVYKLMIGVIVPRPIAFVSSLSADGIPNLAPFSYFTGVCANPPVVCFSPMIRSSDQAHKDTLNNIEATREFVVNIVSEEFAEQMNLCSGEYPPEVDEFQVSGLTPVASDLVKPARVKESHVNMECRLLQVVRVSEKLLGGSIVLGEVLRFHVDDALFEDFRIDPDKLRAFGRMGGNSYARTRDRFELRRPKK